MSKTRSFESYSSLKFVLIPENPYGKIAEQSGKENS